ncbi:MAG: hypothetical protein ACREUG_15485, partial [Steroidobacteraceae bacterium]
MANSASDAHASRITAGTAATRGQSAITTASATDATPTAATVRASVGARRRCSLRAAPTVRPMRSAPAAAREALPRR